MDEHLTRLFALLGPASGPGAAAEDWQRLEAELGVTLAADLKALTERYAPVRLNGSVHLPTRPGAAASTERLGPPR
ncbi:hypothetical protein [Kitasatospora sp. NPDC005748]|uniref:hypothetical protein n=1 Tax=Kitasatospora sp. NPDC005748 TaxID=3157063 RepID=UPI00340A2BA2